MGQFPKSSTKDASKVRTPLTSFDKIAHHSTSCELTVLHHDCEEPHDHFGAGPDQHLPLSTFLCIAERLQRIREHIHVHHG